MTTTTVYITGAAGLVGQNLIAKLATDPRYRVQGGDKNAKNVAILKTLHPDVQVDVIDYAEPGPWTDDVARADVVIMLQAQIGGLRLEEFERNNVTATRLVMDAVARGHGAYVVHVSSSVVNSAAVDFYTETKKAQERLVKTYDVAHVVLRPTLMFGWFDRKHVGWLKRFLDRAPVFPIPGAGRYLRQPLFAGDFCNIIASCVQSRIGGEYNISGTEKIDYVDMIKAVKKVSGAKTPIIHIPYWIFWTLLWLYARFDKNPPFTTSQLKALVTPDVFEVIDWPGIFGVRATPLQEAFETTFLDPKYSNVVLEF